MHAVIVNDSRITVSVDPQCDNAPENPNFWGNVAVTTLDGEGVTTGHIDVVFVDVATMTQLNEQHMGASGPTDVLAFPMDAPQITDLQDAEAGLNGLPVHLGDIVICPQVCAEQAASHVGTLDGEYCLLTIHAALHLVGYDHVTDEERVEMQARERTYLASFGYQHPVDSSS